MKSEDFLKNLIKMTEDTEKKKRSIWGKIGVFCGFRVMESPALPPNEYMLVVGSELYKMIKEEGLNEKNN